MKGTSKNDSGKTAGFYEGEVHNGAGSNTVTLSRPKGESNGEYKADLHTTWKVMSQISDALKHFSCEIKGL